MSSHHQRGPQAPPPPVISRRRSRSRQTRSRSRSPPPSHHRSRYNNSSRDRGRRQSPPSSYGRPGESYRKSEAMPISIAPPHSQLSSHQQSRAPPISHQQSISLIAGESAPPITRRILNPDEVKIPRRAGEGALPIFERAELKEAMLRRIRANDNDENPALSAPVVPEPPQQRVIAIIREPVIDGYLRPSIKEPPRDAGYSTSRHSHLQPVSPEVLRPSAGGSSGFRRPSISPPPPSRERQRRLSPERIVDRKRDLLDEHRDRESVRDREREQYLRENRERPRVQDSRDGRDIRDVRERERINPSSRGRSRSPVRILRDRPERPDRRSRSRSVTPPPMPPEIRRQLLERDLRNKLSRPLTKPLSSKVDSEQEFRSGMSRGGRGFGRGFSRGRGGFSRGLRSRAPVDNRSRGLWEHDMYERDGLDQPGGGSKSNN